MFLKNFFKIALTYDPAIPLLGLPPKEMKSPHQKDSSALIFTAAFSTAKICKQPKCPSTDTQIITHTLEYSAMKEKEILPFTTIWIDFEGTTLSELSQRQTNTI